MGRKEILLIRHGQGDHNMLFYQNKMEEGLALRDPALNDVGLKQASSLGVLLKKQLQELVCYISLLI